MSKIEKTLKEFSDKGILTEESVSALIAEFDEAVTAKALLLKEESVEEEIVEEDGDAQATADDVNAEETIEEDVSTDTGKPLLDALNTLVQSVNNRFVNDGINMVKFMDSLDETQTQIFADQLFATAKLVDSMANFTEESEAYVSPMEEAKKLMEENVQAYKVKLEEETKEMINSYLEEFVMPNVDTMIIEESIKEQQAQLIEESIVKDEAIETLTGLTNKLSGIIKKDPIRTKMIEEAKNSKIGAERISTAAKAERIKKAHIMKQLRKRA
jgi:hypothetical protein